MTTFLLRAIGFMTLYIFVVVNVIRMSHFEGAFDQID